MKKKWLAGAGLCLLLASACFTINADTVFVTDSDGNRQNTKITIADNQRSVFVHSPEKGYSEQTKNYTTHVTKGVAGTMAMPLHSAKKGDFSVVETLPAIQSKQQLNKYFTKILKRSENTGQYGRTVLEDTRSEKSAAPREVSSTNIQVEGIDEPDSVKTDGSYIYQVSGNRVHIVRAAPSGAMKKQADISFDGQSFTPADLFVQGDYLVILGNSHESIHQIKGAQSNKISIWPPRRYSATALIYDVSNRKSPKQIRSIELEGAYQEARLSNGIVYFISQHYPDYWILREDKQADLAPMAADSAVSSDAKPIPYRSIRYFPNSEEPNFTMIAAFNLAKTHEPAAISTYLGGGSQLYMSQNHLYLAVNTNEIPSKNNEYAPDTNVYKFSVKGTEVAFKQSVRVPGTVLNQFSMDEYKGRFRIATTRGNTWSKVKPSANNLYIYDEQLRLEGKLENLAPGERLYSARFMGGRIYLVTFKETDPLFVIDAQNPRKPAVLGELKIPGFSNYLHPYDENHLLGFGYQTRVANDTAPGGQERIIQEGMKISLFDVSDVSRPQEKFTEIIGEAGTYSPLNYNHKALLYNPKTNLFAFPVTVYGKSADRERVPKFLFQGAYVYTIDKNKGFSLHKKISHQRKTTRYEDMETDIQRLLYIDRTLYSLSLSAIKAHDLATFKELNTLYYQ